MPLDCPTNHSNPFAPCSGGAGHCRVWLRVFSLLWHDRVLRQDLYEHPAAAGNAARSVWWDLNMAVQLHVCKLKCLLSLLAPFVLCAVEEQLALVTSSGRPFELISVRVVGEDGNDVAKDSQQVNSHMVVPSDFISRVDLHETADQFSTVGAMYCRLAKCGSAARLCSVVTGACPRLPPRALLRAAGSSKSSATCQPGNSCLCNPHCKLTAWPAPA